MDGIFHEMAQNSRIESANSVAKAARSKSINMQQEVDDLSFKVEKLLMINEALWRIIKENHKLDDAYLSNLIKEIDAEDGRVDGKVAKTAPTKCSACSRPIPRDSNKCMYCREITESSVFKR